MPDGGDVLKPDISVILKENYSIIKGHIHGVPDVVVEILSATTRKRDQGVRAARYLKNGIKEFWIADPEEKSLVLWINHRNPSGENYWEEKRSDKIESSILRVFISKPKMYFQNYKIFSH